jgi:HEAT repeat protein
MREHCRLRIALVVLFLGGQALAVPTVVAFDWQDQESQRSSTPLKFEIDKQRSRLNSLEVEERRDAVSRLGSMHHPDASRAALPALNDSMAIVRATASSAILSLPGDESANSLVPLLSDKDEFVRQETSYALGKTRSRAAVSPLSELLLGDKDDGVRGAAAVALGEIGDSAAVSSLTHVLDPQFAQPASAPGKKKKSKKIKKEANRFVLRAVAHSLGQIKSSAAVPTLVALLQDTNAEDDVRREAAVALGAIGDQSALPALREVLIARDPYLSQAAQEAIRRIMQLPPRLGN